MMRKRALDSIPNEDDRAQRSIELVSKVVNVLTDDASNSAVQLGTERLAEAGKTAPQDTSQEFVPFGEKVLARRISTELTRSMNPRFKFGIWLGMRNNLNSRNVGSSCAAPTLPSCHHATPRCGCCFRRHLRVFVTWSGERILALFSFFFFHVIRV